MTRKTTARQTARRRSVAMLAALIAGVIVVTGSILATPNAVSAASSQIQSYSVWGGPECCTPAGDAHASGNVVWFGKHRFYVDHEVNDICPADGYGAAFRLRIHYMNGSWGDQITVAVDSDGCRSERTYFGREFTRKRRIKRIQLWVTETNGRYGYSGTKKYRDNPYTG